MNDPERQGLRNFSLAAKAVRKIYEKFGVKLVNGLEKIMTIKQSGIYKKDK